MPALSPYLLPIVLLVGSNVFMTVAWYWHLRYTQGATVDGKRHRRTNLL